MSANVTSPCPRNPAHIRRKRHDNKGWNCGHEGLLVGEGQEGVERLRARQARNLLLLTLLARGTPMLLGGDEFLRTQGGNNNAYCQDNPVSWIDWTLARSEAGFLRFTREAIAWRVRIGPPNNWGSPASRVWDRSWQGFTPAGKPWPLDQAPLDRHAAFMLHAAPSHGTWSPSVNPAKEPLWYLLLNGEDNSLLFHLPAVPVGWEWQCVADTSLPSPEDIAADGAGSPLPQTDRCEADARSMVLLRAAQTGSRTL